MLQEFHKDLYLEFIFDGDLVSKLEGLKKPTVMFWDDL